jgi:hypothetical protein
MNWRRFLAQKGGRSDTLHHHCSRGVVLRSRVGRYLTFRLV